MDNFDLKKYLAEGTIHQEITEKKYKQGYDDREDESLGARKGAEKDKKVSMKGRRDDSYGKFGKRDAEAKGKDKGPGKNKINKEGVELKEFDADVVAVGAPLVMSVVAAGVAKMGYDAVMDMIKKKFPKEDAEYSRDEDMEMAEAMRGGSYMEEDDLDEMMRGGKMEEDDLDEAMRGDMDEDDTMREQEDVDVDVDEKEKIDVDVEKDVDVDDVSKESDIEVKSEVPGESADVSAILGLLTKAQERAEKMGDEKLMDQIGNTITYYTRAHVVAEAKDEDDVKEEMKDKKEDVKEELNEEVRRFKKLAGLIK